MAAAERPATACRAPRAARSYRALALAALHLVGLRAAPVDEVVEVFEAELDRHRQVLDLRLELTGADPVDELVERLLAGAVGLVEAQPALDRLGDALRR